MPNIRKLSDELQKIAHDELNETPERIQSDIDALRLWINQTPHLRSRDDDQFLIAFLRGCKYSLEKAKKKIEMFYTARTMTPEFFSDRDPTDKILADVTKLGLIMPLPVNESKADPRIVLTRLGGYDFKYDFVTVMKVTYLMADWCIINSDVTIISGHISIVDLSDCKLSLMQFFTIPLVKKLSSLLEPFPVRVKAIHLVNPIFGMDTAFKLFMSVCHEKLKSRVFLHDNFDALHKVVDKNLLPVEYGGTNSSLPEIVTYWQEKLLESRQWYIDDVQYGVDNVNKSSAADSNPLFGAEGSFRSLNID